MVKAKALSKLLHHFRSSSGTHLNNLKSFQAKSREKSCWGQELWAKDPNPSLSKAKQSPSV